MAADQPAGIPIPGSADDTDDPQSNGVDDMADVPASMHETTLSRLDAIAAVHHEHVNIYSKVLDLQAEERRGLVSLKQSLGVREVTSQSGQSGIPLAGGVFTNPNKP